MSSSIESMSKGEEKKGNSENNPKDDMPKEDTTVESNSKGARQKIDSMSEMPITITAEKKTPLKIMTMNCGTYNPEKSDSKTNKGKKSTSAPGRSQDKNPSSVPGPNQDENTISAPEAGKSPHGKSQDQNTTRRKMIIHDVLKKNKPDIVLLQEFTWPEIDSCPDCILNTQYKFLGNKRTKIMYNTKSIEASVNEEPQNILQKHKSYLEKIDGENIALQVFKAKDNEFICISWHGPYKKKKKKDVFQRLLNCLQEIYQRTEKPLLIGGDFNVTMEEVENLVQPPLCLKTYTASERRMNKEIDFFIISKGLKLSDIKPVKLKEDSKDKDPEKVLDHDPIITDLDFDQFDTAPPQDKVTDTHKDIDDLMQSLCLNSPSTTQVDRKKDLEPNKPEEV